MKKKADATGVESFKAKQALKNARTIIGAAITVCENHLTSGDVVAAQATTTGIPEIDSLLPHVVPAPDVPLHRAPRAFLKAVFKVIEQAGLGDRASKDEIKRRKRVTSKAEDAIKEAARLLKEIHNEPVADLLDEIAVNVGARAAAMRLVPYSVHEANGWRLDYYNDIAFISAMSPGTDNRAGAIRMLASLVDPATPKLNNRLSALFKALGVPCRQADVQQALSMPKWRKDWMNYFRR